MEPKYVISIVLLGTFSILFLLYLIFSVQKKSREARQRRFVLEMYEKNNQEKFNYDAVDENAPPIVEGRASAADTLATTKDEDDHAVQIHLDELLGKVEKDGIEEITGCYKQY